jgi:hypothetical protein
MIIYIVGYGRSGSTILAKTLEEKLNAVNLGEVKYLYRSDKNDLLHPYWRSFKQKNEDLVNDPTFNFLKYDSILGFFLIGEGRKRKYCKRWQEIFRRMGLKPEEDIIIDSSKTPLDSIMRGIRLYKCFQNVLFIQPKRNFFDILRSLLKGKNSNIERGARKSRLLRFLQTFLISLPHMTVTYLLTLLYRSYGLEVIDIEDLEKGLNVFVEKNNLQKMENSSSIPMIYGNRSRKELDRNEL